MYTTNEDGMLQTHAVEPKVYLATYPSPKEQQRYTLQVAIAAGLVVLSFLTAFAVS